MSDENEKRAIKIVMPCREWFSKYANKIDHSKRVRLGVLRKRITEALDEQSEYIRLLEAVEKAARIGATFDIFNVPLDVLDEFRKGKK